MSTYTPATMSSCLFWILRDRNCIRCGVFICPVSSMSAPSARACNLQRHQFWLKTVFQPQTWLCTYSVILLRRLQWQRPDVVPASVLVFTVLSVSSLLSGFFLSFFCGSRFVSLHHRAVCHSFSHYWCKLECEYLKNARAGHINQSWHEHVHVYK